MERLMRAVLEVSSRVLSHGVLCTSCKQRSLEEAEVKKIILLAPLLASLILLSQPVFAEPTQTFHVEGKAAVAWDPCYNVVYIVAEGMLNLPDGTPIKGLTLVIIRGHNQPRCVPLRKNDFKWSMDHASLCSGKLHIEWYTGPPTETGHINLKDCIHLVVNEQAREGFACIWHDGCPTPAYGACGLVLHGTGMLALSLPEE